MNIDEIRELARQAIREVNLGEHDALYSKNKEWKDESRELKSLLVDLLKNIENDEYSEGAKKIDSVVSKLKVWKNKIEKFID